MSLEFKPNSPYANIHGMIENGKQTCKTKSGSLCTGCCWALRVIEEGRLISEEGKKCEHQGKGCKLFGKTKRPNICKKYHCCSDVSKMKTDLAARQRVFLSLSAALQNREIDQEHFEESLRRLGLI